MPSCLKRDGLKDVLLLDGAGCIHRVRDSAVELQEPCFLQWIGCRNRSIERSLDVKRQYPCGISRELTTYLDSLKPRVTR